MKFLTATGALLLVFALLFGITAGHEDEDCTKIIVIILGIHKEVVEKEMVEIQYGHAPNLGLQQGNFTATIRAENGTALFVFDVWDPRFQLEDFGYHQALTHHEEMEDPALEAAYRSAGESEDIDLPIIIPYHHDIRTIELVDKNTGALLISVNVSPAVEDFCARFPRDPDMLAHSSAESAHPPELQSGETHIFLTAGMVLGFILLAALAALVRRT